jgi:putative nucleotidyltransferase with HDIG domain
MTTPATPKPIYIHVSQLCIGIFVHLDLSWMDHSFPLNSFKIKTAKQIAAIKQLGLTKIRVNPVRSDCRPLPLTAPSAAEADAEVEVVAEPSAEEIVAIAEKKARVERLIKIRAAAAQCEKQMLKAAGAIKNINQNIFSQPQRAYDDAFELVQQMLDSLLTDKDVAIHLMNDKSAGEDIYFHSLNVAVLSMMLAKELGMSAKEIEELGMGSLFHDIGKIEIPDRIVRKTEPLTRPEESFMQLHGQYGEAIGKKVGLPKEVIAIIVQHHEYLDGSGYPARLKGEQISKLARIVSIVNAYDNLCNRPNVNDSLSPSKALSFMFAHQRALFDPTALSVFIRCLGVYPPGTIVRLSNGMTGLVVSVNSSKPLRPSVLVYDPDVPKNEAMILDLLSEEDVHVDSSIDPSKLARDVHAYLSPRSRMNYYFEAPVSDKNAPG